MDRWDLPDKTFNIKLTGVDYEMIVNGDYSEIEPILIDIINQIESQLPPNVRLNGGN